ncbi:unnamed protein product [Blepharisma stoltei]|uniref:Uncharacterized protein n=1 Tax=Blepharisma stoltei TaxID=1481888 RepID=A0AAU9J3M9_9CILI|nr:unnamed protein product [Blepharisma stoltei]
MTSMQDPKYLRTQITVKPDPNKLTQQQPNPYLSKISRSSTSLLSKTPLNSRYISTQNNPIIQTNSQINKSLTILRQNSTFLEQFPDAAQRRQSTFLKKDSLHPSVRNSNKSRTIIQHSNSSFLAAIPDEYKRKQSTILKKDTLKPNLRNPTKSRTIIKHSDSVYLEPIPNNQKRRTSTLMKVDTMKGINNENQYSDNFDQIYQALHDKINKDHDEINYHELVSWTLNEIATRIPYIDLFKLLRDCFFCISLSSENNPLVLHLKDEIQTLESEALRLKNINITIENKLKALSEENVKYANQVDELNREVRNWRIVKEKGLDFSKGSVEAKLILDENSKKGEIIRELKEEIQDLKLKIAKLTSALCLIEQQGGLTTKFLQDLKEQVKLDANGRRQSAIFAPSALMSTGLIIEESKELDCLRNIDMILSDDMFLQKRVSPVPALKLSELKQENEE